MILIDVPMPEKCGLCPLFHAEHPMYCQGVKADRKKKIVAPYGQPRPDWCPLHDVTADEDTISRQSAIEAVEFGITYAKAINKETGEVVELFRKSNDELRKAVDRIKQLPPSLTPSRLTDVFPEDCPCDDCDVADKCTFESNCPREAIWKAEHEGGCGDG